MVGAYLVLVASIGLDEFGTTVYPTFKSLKLGCHVRQRWGQDDPSSLKPTMPITWMSKEVSKRLVSGL